MKKAPHPLTVTLDVRAKQALAYIGGIPPSPGDNAITLASTTSDEVKNHFNYLLDSWLNLHESELASMGNTILGIIQQVDLSKKKIRDRLGSLDYIRLLRKSFRSFAIIESEFKQKMLQQLLIKAAIIHSSPDYALFQFIDWLDQFSDEHFAYVKALARAGQTGLTRKAIWLQFHPDIPGEDTASADLYKTILLDLTRTHLVRQTREKDFYGRFLKNVAIPTESGRGGALTSAFDDQKYYHLTELGRQFSRYVFS